MREKLGRKLEAFTTYSLNEYGLYARHRDFNKPDSHSGTDVTVQYGTTKATVECKNLAMSKYHKCSYKWVLTKVVARFNMLDGCVHILVISYRDMLSKSAQSLLEALNIHIVELGVQINVNQHTQQVMPLRQQIATTIKNLLSKVPTNKIEITTQNYTNTPYSVELESVYEPLRGTTVIVNQSQPYLSPNI
jgi:hypothetical protein